MNVAYKHQKFQCLKVEYSEELKTEVLGTFHTIAEALEFINEFIRDNYEEQPYIAITHDNEFSKGIFERGVVYGKTLKARIHIVKFNDIDSKEIPKY